MCQCFHLKGKHIVFLCLIFLKHISLKAKQRQKLIKVIVSFPSLDSQKIHFQDTKWPKLNLIHLVESISLCTVTSYIFQKLTIKQLTILDSCMNFVLQTAKRQRSAMLCNRKWSPEIQTIGLTLY